MFRKAMVVDCGSDRVLQLHQNLEETDRARAEFKWKIMTPDSGVSWKNGQRNCRPFVGMKHWQRF